MYFSSSLARSAASYVALALCPAMSIIFAESAEIATTKDWNRDKKQNAQDRAFCYRQLPGGKDMYSNST
jgi:hypothetical protein